MTSRRQLIRPHSRRKKEQPTPPVLSKQGEEYIGLAKDAAKRLMSFGLIWGVALLVSFLLIDSEVSDRLDEIRKSRSNIVSLEKDIDIAPVDKKPALEEKLAVLKNRRSDLGAPISFPLPGLTPIPISPPLAPALWLLVACLVVVHLLGVRRHAHGYLALALSMTPEESRGKAIAAPLRSLLAPLPVRDGHIVSARHYSLAYGVHSKPSGRMLVTLGLTCLIALQGRMLWVQSNLALHIKPTWLNPTLQVVSLAVVGMTLLLCFAWLRSWRVPDADFQPHGQYSAHRRDLLRLGLGTSAFIALGTLLPPRLRSEASALKKIARPVLAAVRANPRFRQFPKNLDVGSTLPDGAALNPRTGTLHLISAGKLIDVGARRTKTEAFVGLSLTALQSSLLQTTLRFRRTHAPRIVEGAIRAALETKRRRPRDVSPVVDVDAELSLLMLAIKQDYASKVKAQRTTTIGVHRVRKRQGAPTDKTAEMINQPHGHTFPSVAIHLYDRVAKTAAGKNRPKFLKDLIVFMKTNGLEVAFPKRMQKWSDPKWIASMR